MDKQITKVQFRQDTLKNWEEANPVLGSGEPAIALGRDVVFKIGDGVTPWKDLKTQSSLSVIAEPSDDGKLYGRVRNENAVSGYWQEIIMPKLDNRLNYNDILQTPIDTELDMNMIIDVNGTKKKVFAVRKRVTGINIDAVSPKSVKQILADVYSVVDMYGTFECSHDHIFALNSYNSEVCVYTYLDSQTNLITLVADLIDDTKQLYNAVANVTILYTKVNDGLDAEQPTPEEDAD